MNVLIKIHRSPIEIFLVCLPGGDIIKEINELIRRGKYLKAIDKAINKGRFVKEVKESELREISAGLILTEKSAHWEAGC